MRRRTIWWYAVAILGIQLLTTPAQGQDAEDRDTWGGGDDVWTNDDAWEDLDGQPSGAPSPVDADRWAQVNSGTVIVDGDIGTSGLSINGGTVQVNDGASLTIDIVDGAFSVGQSQIGRNGTLQLQGSGKYVSSLSVSNSGTIDLQTPAAALEAGGDFSSSGTLHVAIGESATSSITAGGAASISGVVSPTFDGVAPKFGDSWQFLTGGGGVDVGKASVALPDSVALESGLSARVEGGDGTASLTIGNLPVLRVDRASGAASVNNVVGGDLTMTGYSITSSLGLLNGEGFTGTGVEGFDTPNPQSNSIAEFSLAGSQTLAVGDSVSIGNAYDGGATHPRDEDVAFEFSTTNGEILQGLVEYVGPPNDLVVNANPDTGEVSIYHLSQHLDAVDLTGYQIDSPSGSLNPDNFTGLSDSGAAGAGWTSANPNANGISELNLNASSSVGNGTVFSLGNIFDTAGTQDLSFRFTTATDLLEGTITYGEVPGGGGPVVGPGCTPANALAGDLDGNGSVEFADFLVLSSNFGNAVGNYADGDVDCNGTVEFADFLTLSSNFGESLPQAAAVPEPNATPLFALGAASLLALRRRRAQRSAAGRKIIASKGFLVAGALVAWAVLAAPNQAFAQMDVLMGEIIPIQSPNDILTLDAPDTIVYAVNVWGEADRKVRGVDFWSDIDDTRPELDGYSTDFTHDVTNWQTKPEFGDTDDDNELEEIMSDIRWTNNEGGEEFGVGIHMDVTATTTYTMQLLISGNHEEDRVWDIWLDEELLVDEFQSNADEDYDIGTVYAYTHTFTATDNVADVTFTQGTTRF